MSAYYNENDPKAAAWLRELIKEGHIAAGDVDERSIEDIRPRELAGYQQCHFFAGIGGWSYALRLAGVSDSTHVWTGSCPCQPFSAAGKGKGFADERHLWPAWFHLIQECRPERLFGEQVANSMQWIDLVQTDLEAKGYAFGYAVLGAHSVGAPHIRQRLYWMAESRRQRFERVRLLVQPGQSRLDNPEAAWGSEAGELAVSEGQQLDRAGNQGRGRGEPADGSGVGDASGAGSGRDAGTVLGAKEKFRRSLRRFIDESELASGLGDVAHTDGWDASTQRQQRSGQHGLLEEDGGTGSLEHAEGDGRIERRPEPGERRAVGGCWTCDWIPCTDGKARPVEPGTFPLAHGIPHRVGLLRGYGNAIVPQDAAIFIQATGVV